MITRKHIKVGVFWVYKFRVKGTKFFYIGVTCSIDLRKSAHVSKILNCINQLKNESIVSKKLGSYKKLAEYFMSHKDFHKIDYMYLWDRFKMEVIAIVDTPEQAAEMESSLLKKYINNNACLNTNPISTYGIKSKKK